MSNLKGTKTCENLLKAFAGESQARNRYTYYASLARKQGFAQIADIFEETADNERMHAKLFLKHLINNGMEGEGIEITATYPAALSNDTLKNLEYAANGENEEWTMIYPEFARIAEEEGFKDIATTFKLIAKVEEKHEIRYRKLWKNVQEHTVFKKEGKVFWICKVCGYVTENILAPEVCPCCAHPQAHFEMFIENY